MVLSVILKTKGPDHSWDYLSVNKAISSNSAILNSTWVFILHIISAGHSILFPEYKNQYFRNKISPCNSKMCSHNLQGHVLHFFTCIKHIEIIWKLHIEMTDCIIEPSNIWLETKSSCKVVELVDCHKENRRIWHIVFWPGILACNNKILV